jgi:predicted PurR-regulated permease PerM
VLIGVDMARENRFYSIVLIVILIVLGYFSYQIISPFLNPIMWAIVLSLVFYPVYAFILKYVKYKFISSILTLLIIILILIGPFSYFAYVLSQELISLVSHFQGQDGNAGVVRTLLSHPLVSSTVQKILYALHMTEQELYSTISASLMNFAKQSTGLIKSGFGNVLTVGMHFVLMLLSIFFFLEDGPAFIEKLENFMPFSRRQRTRLLKQTKDIVVSTIYGGVVVGMAQGLIGGAAFAALGIHSPVFWGLAMFVASFVPVVGTFVIWGPGVIYLLFQTQYLKAIILLVVGIVIIAGIDNVLRPLMVRGKIKMPTIAIFFAILGGIQAFGLIGLILGPLVVALFLSVFEIFRYSEEERSRAGEEQSPHEKIDAKE